MILPGEALSEREELNDGGRTRMRLRFVGRIIVAVASVMMVWVGTAEARSLPKLLNGYVKHPFQIRPRSISFTGDGTGYAGRIYTGARAVNPPGSLHWTSWNSGRAYGVGTIWINNGIPDDADGTFYAHHGTVMAFRPRRGHFTRMVIRFRYSGHWVKDIRVLQWVPPSSFFHGYYDWSVPN